MIRLVAEVREMKTSDVFEPTDAFDLLVDVETIRRLSLELVAENVSLEEISELAAEEDAVVGVVTFMADTVVELGTLEKTDDAYDTSGTLLEPSDASSRVSVDIIDSVDRVRRSEDVLLDTTSVIVLCGNPTLAGYSDISRDELE